MQTDYSLYSKPVQEDYIAKFNFYEQNGEKFWFKNLKIKDCNETLIIKFVSNSRFVKLQGISIKAYITVAANAGYRKLLEELKEGDQIEFSSEEIVQERANDNYFQVINPTEIKRYINN